MQIFEPELIDPFLEHASNSDSGDWDLHHELTLWEQHMSRFELTIGNVVANIFAIDRYIGLLMRRSVVVTDTENKDH